MEPIRTICGLYFENDVMKRSVKQAKKSKSNMENISFSKLLEELTTEKCHEK
ncbi:hypothetical protein [Clostridium ganghwense]|uniref:hypothetical protein n=1 Tax=Clostridium ganghwense TaxID=312089 RepID=UPI00227D55D7|nr:hypothetical protein [Clostridium ganghwense]